MNDAAPRRSSVPAEAVGHVGLPTLTAHPGLRAGLRHGSPLELVVAQATVAALLALAASFLTGRGLGEGFILGAAALVLVVSGLLLVVWSDPDDRAQPPA